MLLVLLSLATPRLTAAVGMAHQREEVVLEAQSVHRQQGEVAHTRQKALQHGRAVLDTIESHCAWVNLQERGREHT